MHLNVQVPSILSWRTMKEHGNLYNTQCTFAIWAMKTATDKLLARGGLKVIQARVHERAKRVRPPACPHFAGH